MAPCDLVLRLSGVSIVTKFCPILHSCVALLRSCLISSSSCGWAVHQGLDGSVRPYIIFMLLSSSTIGVDYKTIIIFIRLNSVEICGA